VFSALHDIPAPPAMPHRLKPAVIHLLCAFICAAAHAQKISPLGSKPDWSRLEAFQETITHDEFVRLLDKVYAPKDAYKNCITIDAGSAQIAETTEPLAQFTLRFAASAGAAKKPPRYWRPASSLTPAKPASKPLAGLKIALDPGHLGGKWAKMEGRWFRIGDSKPVTEGDMTLRVARRLAPKLRALGAAVSFVRDSSTPLTALRPASPRVREAAQRELDEHPVAPQEDTEHPKTSEEILESTAERLFYRVAEIHRRARFVNREIKPDLTICLHFNAEAWGDPDDPTLTEKNHLHVMVNGCYSADELANDDVRFEMLLKLLTRCFDEENAVSGTVANFMAGATGLPAYEYTSGNAIRTGKNPYIWARNLLANRLFRCPVVYLEPYVMNSQPVFDRIQLGDYDGEREIGGVMRKSIFREYADAVAEGLAAHYAKARREK
jgi:hypothetical protein